MVIKSKVIKLTPVKIRVVRQVNVNSFELTKMILFNFFIKKSN